MIKKSKKDEAILLLKGAYALKTPEDSVIYYKGFSKLYDKTYVEELAYIYPKGVALELFNNYDGNGNICDIGCGTGLVGEELYSLNSNFVIDGIDISPDMISVAKEKNLYRNLYEIDLNQPILNVPKNYSALISSGTFTHGHLGPEVLVSLLSICKEDAILTIGINALYYHKKGFEKVLNKLELENKIRMIKISSIPIYSSKDKIQNEENQLAIICTFAKINS